MANAAEEVGKEVEPLPDSIRSGKTTSRRKATVSMDLSAEEVRIGRTHPATDVHTNSEDELGA